MTDILQACPDNVNISFIIHGWSEGIYTTRWIPFVFQQTMKFSGGCVVLMDYSYFSAMGYGDLAYRYYLLRDLLVTVVRLFGNFSRMHFFGFSFGARLAIGEMSLQNHMVEFHKFQEWIFVTLLVHISQLQNFHLHQHKKQLHLFKLPTQIVLTMALEFMMVILTLKWDIVDYGRMDKVLHQW
jgi:hypothetical protein